MFFEEHVVQEQLRCREQLAKAAPGSWEGRARGRCATARRDHAARRAAQKGRRCADAKGGLRGPGSQPSLEATGHTGTWSGRALSTSVYLQVLRMPRLCGCRAISSIPSSSSTSPPPRRHPVRRRAPADPGPQFRSLRHAPPQRTRATRGAIHNHSPTPCFTSRHATARPQALALTFIAYAMLHAARKPPSVMKRYGAAPAAAAAARAGRRRGCRGPCVRLPRRTPAAAAAPAAATSGAGHAAVR